MDKYSMFWSITLMTRYTEEALEKLWQEDPKKVEELYEIHVEKRA
ncbi:hypothetical protein [Pseudobacillus badius]|nr:hypothetical protein [Bacillus badius]